jgi:hypothetical protein
MKRYWLCALVPILLGVAAARAEYPTTSSGADVSTGGTGGPPSGVTTSVTVDLPTTPMPPSPGLSSWIVGNQPGCCGPLGGNGPIQIEPYFRFGPSVPVHGFIFEKTLTTGWVFAGGGRSLFFDADQTAAWTIDLGLSNVANHGKSPEIRIPLRGILVPTSNGQGAARIPLLPVTVESLNRTYANLGFGRECYLLGAANNCDGWNWKVGVDGGGRWGTERLETHELRHRSDVCGSLFAAAYSDVEYPCGGAVFQAGIRIEWDYNWSDILQLQNNSDMQDLNFLLNLGFRF